MSLESKLEKLSLYVDNTSKTYDEIMKKGERKRSSSADYEEELKNCRIPELKRYLRRKKKGKDNYDEDFYNAVENRLYALQEYEDEQINLTRTMNMEEVEECLELITKRTKKGGAIKKTKRKNKKDNEEDGIRIVTVEDDMKIRILEERKKELDAQQRTIATTRSGRRVKRPISDRERYSEIFREFDEKQAKEDAKKEKEPESDSDFHTCSFCEKENCEINEHDAGTAIIYYCNSEDCREAFENFLENDCDEDGWWRAGEGIGDEGGGGDDSDEMTEGEESDFEESEIESEEEEDNSYQSPTEEDYERELEEDAEIEEELSTEESESEPKTESESEYSASESESESEEEVIRRKRNKRHKPVMDMIESEEEEDEDMGNLTPTGKAAPLTPVGSHNGFDIDISDDEE